VVVIAGKGRNRSFGFPAVVKPTLRPNAGEEGRAKTIGSLPMAERTKRESDSGREFGFSDVRLPHLGAQDKAWIGDA